MKKIIKLDAGKLRDYLKYEPAIEVVSICLSSEKAPTDSVDVSFNGEEKLTVHIKNAKIIFYTDADRIKVIGSLSKMFFDFPHLSDIRFLSKWDVSEVTDMSWMFSYCDSLSDLSPLKDWDISSVKDMSGMFSHNGSLQDISGIESWDLSNVKNIENMFEDCEKLQKI